ncbi:MAG: solute carrier family 23 protein, partial [Pseudomonadales bacterium]
MTSETTLSVRSFMIGGQHALAAVGGIVAAPLVIALGMGLSADDTRYVISAALVVSGIATVIQILRIGPIGSGLLSIQGTSFAFVGPLIYV